MGTSRPTTSTGPVPDFRRCETARWTGRLNSLRMREGAGDLSTVATTSVAVLELVQLTGWESAHWGM